MDDDARKLLVEKSENRPRGLTGKIIVLERSSLVEGESTGLEHE